MKKKLLVVSVILGMGILLFLLFERRQGWMNLSIEQIEEVYIEVLSLDELSVEKVSVEKEDAEIIKKMFLGEEIYSDIGFVFAEGGYRIVMDTGKELINLYPYCGVAGTFKVGEEGNNYIFFDADKEEVLKKILDKYDKGREGIWVWDNVE